MSVFRSNSPIGGKPPLGSAIDWLHPLAIGLRFMTMLNEGDGPPGDLVGRAGGTLVSSVVPPVWDVNGAGVSIRGFAATDYYQWVPAYPVVGVYPFSMASLAANAQAVNGRATLCYGNSGTATPFAALRYNHNGNGVVGYSIRDDSNNYSNLSVAQSNFADGLPHVLQGVSYSATDHRVYWDGVQVTSGSTNLAAAITVNTLVLGVLKTNVASSPFIEHISWAGVWAGGCPDPAVVAECLLSGDYPVLGGRLNVPRRVSYFYSSSVVGPVLFSSHYTNQGIR